MKNSRYGNEKVEENEQVRSNRVKNRTIHLDKYLKCLKNYEYV